MPHRQSKFQTICRFTPIPYSPVWKWHILTATFCEIPRTKIGVQDFLSVIPGVAIRIIY